MNPLPDRASMLFDADALRLTKKQREALPGLHELLASNEGNVARALMLCDGSLWVNGEMRELEKTLLRVVPRKHLAESFQTLSKIVDRYRRLTETAAPYPRSVHLVKLEKNPFRNKDLAASDDLVRNVDVQIFRGGQQSGTLMARGVIATVVRFYLLHKSMLIALIEALADPNDALLRLDGNIGAWVLSLACMGEESAERRLLIPDIATGTLLAKIAAKDVRDQFAPGLDSNLDLKRRHAWIWKELQRITSSYLADSDLSRNATLPKILNAARDVAYLHMPAAIAAHRCRKSVSHAPRLPVLQRLLGQNADTNRENADISDYLSRDEQICFNKEVSDITEVEPGWLTDLRNAFRKAKQKQVAEKLNQISNVADPAGERMIRFASWLLEDQQLSASTTKRHCLLMARRLGCRLGGTDPAALKIDELESHYWEVLDDDFDRDVPASSEQADRRSRRAAAQAVRHFHRYIVETESVADLDELAFLKNSTGLLPVDANFITIDEFEKVLDAIQDWPGLQLEERGLLRWIVTLAFRCGLRRREVLFLTWKDLDDADYLHIRKNRFRELKTPNARRTLPLPALLSPDELKKFKSWRDYSKGLSTSDLIFGGWATDADVPGGYGWKKVWPEKHVANIHEILRSELADHTLKMHHLRHSFATLLIARLLPDMSQTAEILLHRHPKTLAWLADGENFRKQLFGTSGLRGLDFEAVAHLLGHSSPGTSVEHYIHCLDWYLREDKKQ